MTIDDVRDEKDAVESEHATGAKALNETKQNLILSEHEREHSGNRNITGRCPGVAGEQ